MRAALVFCVLAVFAVAVQGQACGVGAQHYCCAETHNQCLAIQAHCASLQASADALSAYVELEVVAIHDAAVAAYNSCLRVQATCFGIDSAACCTANHLKWVDWTSISGNTIYGTVTPTVGTPISVSISGVFLGYGLSGSPPWQWGVGTAFSSGTILDPPGAHTGDYIQFHQPNPISAPVVLTFSRPVNVFMAWLSVGGANPVEITFSQGFQVESTGSHYYGNGQFTQLGCVLTGDEGSGIIQFPSATSQITFWMDRAEFWYATTVAIGDGCAA